MSAPYLRFKVTIKKASPNYNERDGITYTTEARDKAQAIRFIRRQATDDGLVGFGQGRYTIKAELDIA